MPTISLEQDAKYRHDGDRYVEVCSQCDRPRTADTCACGAAFQRIERKFLTLSWTATTLTPTMPDVCPHCEQKPTHVRSVTMKAPTKAKGIGGAVWTTVTIEVPSCRKMLPPFLAYLLLVTAIFFTVVFGLATLFGNGVVAAVLAALSLFAVFAAWRAYGWIRFARIDHRSLRFRARRPGYAAALAERNGGRVI